LVSEGQSRRELQRNVGIYNLVWGGCGALAYFCGGAIFKAAGFRAMFVVPAAVHVLQLITTVFVERVSHGSVADTRAASRATDDDVLQLECERLPSSVSPERFLR